MKLRAISSIVLLSCLVIFLINHCASAPKSEKYLVKLYISKQAFDYESPWLNLNSEMENYYGTVVSKNVILTTAEAVKDHTLIEAQPFGALEKFQVDVLWVDYEANLAALSVPDKLKKHKLRPISLILDKPENPQLVKAKDTQGTMKTDVTFSKAEVRQADISHYTYTQLIFNAVQKGSGFGEPIVDQNKLVGITSKQKDALIYVIPSMIIRHFLNDDFEKGKYKGFAKLGLFTSPLVDPVELESYGLDKDATGLLVRRVISGSSATNLIEVNDIITHIEGYRLDKQGFIQHPVWGYLHFSSLINEKYSGEKIELDIIRNKKSMEVILPLSPFDSNQGIFHIINSPGEQDYRIVGGLVFQEMSVGFLRIWGKRWEDSAPAHFLFLLMKNLDFGYTRQRQVFLNKVLADSGNRGYENIKYAAVNKVNDEPIYSLEDLDKALEKPITHDGKNYFKFDLADGGGVIVLDKDKVPGIDARVRISYNLP